MVRGVFDAGRRGELATAKSGSIRMSGGHPAHAESADRQRCARRDVADCFGGRHHPFVHTTLYP